MFLICYIFFSSLFQEYSLRTGFGLLHYYTTIVIYFIYLSTDKITKPICNLMHYTTNNNLTFILLINASYTIHKFEYSNLTIQLFVRQNCLIKNSSKSNQYWNTFNISTRSAIPRVKRHAICNRSKEETTFRIPSENCQVERIEHRERKQFRENSWRILLQLRSGGIFDVWWPSREIALFRQISLFTMFPFS